MTEPSACNTENPVSVQEDVQGCEVMPRAELPAAAQGIELGAEDAPLAQSDTSQEGLVQLRDAQRSEHREQPAKSEVDPTSHPAQKSEGAIESKEALLKDGEALFAAEKVETRRELSRLDAEMVNELSQAEVRGGAYNSARSGSRAEERVADGPLFRVKRSAM